MLENEFLASVWGLITLVIIATTESYQPSFESSLFKEQQNSEWLSGEIDCHFLKVTDYIDCVSIKDEGPLGYSKDNCD